MANETEFSNYNTVAAYIAANVVPGFYSNNVTRDAFMRETLLGNTKAHKFTIQGTLAASAVSESAQATRAEYTETNVTATASKVKVYSALTEEAEVFVGSSKVDELIRLSGLAIAKKFDQDVLALASGFSTTAGTTGNALTIANFLEAQYQLDLDDVPGEKVAFLHSKQDYDLKLEIEANTASIYGAGAGQSVINSNGQVDRELFGTRIKVSNNVSGDGTDYSGLMATRFAIGIVEANGGVPIVTIAPNVEYGLTEIGVSVFYGVVEAKDSAGVELLSVD